MELFEQIRLGYAAGETILGLANKHGAHPRMVRQAVASAIPPNRKAYERVKPKLDSVKAFIDSILNTDQNAPRKQRHTSHRIWARIQSEMPDQQISESHLRRYIRKRKRELGLAAGGEVFVPQSYAFGQEAQVDWYEAAAKQFHDAVLAEILDEPVVSSRNRRNPRGVKRKMSNYPLRRGYERSPLIDISAAIRIVK